MPNLAIAGLVLLGLAVLVAVVCVVVCRIRARILRNEDAAATEITLAGVIDEDADMPEPDETELQEALRKARLSYVDPPAEAVAPVPFSDPTETFNAEARETLSSVASNLIFVDIEPGRSYSEIPDATDPWLSDAEVYESTEIALATIAAISNAELGIPERSGEEWEQSFRGFDPNREWLRINAALTDPMVADVLKQRDPMMAFLLPVDVNEPLPDFDESASAWASRNRRDETHDIDGISLSWHTGLTQAMRLISQPALESSKRAR